MNRSPSPRWQPLSEGELVADLNRAQPGTPEALVEVLDRHLPRTLQLWILREIFFRAADAICVMGHEGRLVLVNQAFCELAGRPMN